MEMTIGKGGERLRHPTDKDTIKEKYRELTEHVRVSLVAQR